MVRVLSVVLAALAAQILAPISAGALTINGPTSEWDALVYVGLTPDPVDDHQTGQPEADLVGDVNFAALYTQYDPGALPGTGDDLLAFRLRLGSEESPTGFSHVGLVGMDADLDGSVDVFIALNNSGQDAIELYTTGNKANISPNTTSTKSTTYSYTETAANYDWSQVSFGNCSECAVAADLDLDSDGNDFFLSFAVPFDDIVAVIEMDGIFGTTPSTQVSYVIGTSVNANAYNQDLGGVDGDPVSSATWDTLGAISVQSGINPVPEPGSALLLGLGLCGLAASRRSGSARPLP
jgi:hypothetical protein